ncbi:hypothetical protein ACHHYP_14603 [Achlya hypogyna]|uniref:EF-hand domain-containing protein n=1 Tax=Achlya hypogyna TaxID=1202772 RepID=A0A1V9YCM1_ACHHY|nr:hypothetical protein ACHHYP_14603 [Achlya hypogyna]
MARHVSLDENIQLHRVFRTLTVEIPEKRLTRKLLAIDAKIAEFRHGSAASRMSDVSEACAAEIQRLEGKWASIHAERQRLRDVTLQDDVLFARSIDKTALFDVYERLGYPKTLSEIEDVIWEVNDGLNGTIAWDEYSRSFERCKADKTCLEPSDLFHLTCFLMYDRDCTGKVSMDDAMHILFLKHGNNMEDEMEALFGKSNSDDYVATLSFQKYAEAVNKRRNDIIDNSGLSTRLPGKKTKAK